MADNKEFRLVFKQLKNIFEPYILKLVPVIDTKDYLYLDTPYFLKSKKPLFFGAVRIMKNYVSVHLMLIYIFPEMVKDISPELKKHMQGKSCFNFKTVDEKLFKELAVLTKRCVEKFNNKKTIAKLLESKDGI